MDEERVKKDATSRVRTAAQQANALAIALDDLHARLRAGPHGVETDDILRLRDHSIDLARRMRGLEERARRLQYRLDRARP